MARSIWNGEDPVANAGRKEAIAARQKAARERDQRRDAATREMRGSRRSI